MSYARLNTRNESGIHPNLRGMGAYAPLATRNGNGISPNFRGLGDIPLTNLTIGPGGQFAVSTVTTPTSASIWDQMLTWMGSSTLLPGMPNSIFAIAAGLFVAVKVFGGKR